ncbi:biopolymer transporter ExbD [Aureibaculum sp. 2210JD6-5]|uniref:ExbD/TolR family protein n=1 Tax=Aureibaculum sp. 2210JD6-5 TaxID=3103957 RepID=UPI002AACE3D5|nr:biopolymer transporter ExbD [Aureibaculum sp. 2210JD6-5]MDY7396014.1 biopolymer transporter ExbD [Aureibaculum sp. 2210JD6-5]
MARRDTPEINAGSMADIAFLLLIFFLVTTTMDTDIGISRKLPEKQDPNVTPPILKEKNVFEVNVNRNDEILVEGETYMQVKDLREAAMKFIDNGGGTAADLQKEGLTPCTWCEGDKDPASSDHPKKAVISLQSDRGTSYAMYIAVQNELVGAYTDLRNKYAQKKYGRAYEDLPAAQQENISKEIYPQIISEAEPTK